MYWVRLRETIKEGENMNLGAFYGRIINIHSMMEEYKRMGGDLKGIKMSSQREIQLKW